MTTAITAAIPKDLWDSMIADLRASTYWDSGRRNGLAARMRESISQGYSGEAVHVKREDWLKLANKVALNPIDPSNLIERMESIVVEPTL